MSIRTSIMASVTACAAALACWGVTPAAWASPAEHGEATAREITVLSWNTHHGEGPDHQLDLQRIADAIDTVKPDVVLLQETDRHYGQRSLWADQPSWYAKALGMHMTFAPNLDLPHPEEDKPRRQYGVTTLSRYPMNNTQHFLLPTPSQLEQRGALLSFVNVDGVPLGFVNTHLQYHLPLQFAPEITDNDRLLQAQRIRDIIDGLGTPVVVAGDFNARPGSPPLQTLLDPYRDAWQEAGIGEGHTRFYADAPENNKRIDYIVVSPQPRITVLNAEVLVSDASDHRPLVTRLRIPV